MRTPLLTLTVAGAALLAGAPAALANTVVSIKTGTFGQGLSGTYLNVTDPLSPFDKRMEVEVTRVGNQLKVVDLNGQVNAQGTSCQASGAAVFCPAANVVGQRIELGDNNDVARTFVDLPAVMLGDGGDDELHGFSADDQMDGNGGKDTLFGRAGRDVFFHNDDNDAFDGGDDVDTASYSSAGAVSVKLDTVGFDDGPANDPDKLLDTENIIGSPGNDFLRGNDLRNVISGRDGADTIVGLGGNDAFDGGAGGDSFSGNGGVDTVTYADRTAPVTVTIGAANPDGEAGENDDVRFDIERVDGGSAADDLDGDGSAETLNGNGGADTLDGDLGADDLNGGTGFDRVDYSSRTNDVTVTLDNASASDGELTEGDSVNDIEGVNSGTGDDTITGGPGVNAIDAGGGNDHVFIRDGVNDAPVACGGGTDEIQTDPFPTDFHNLLGQLQLQDCEVFLP